MYDHDKLMLISEYLNTYEQDMYKELIRASDDIIPLIRTHLSVVYEIIDYIEQTTGLVIRTSY